MRFAVLVDLRFAVLFDVRFAPLLDVRDLVLAEGRVVLVPLRAAAGFPFADFVPRELLLPEDFVDPCSFAASQSAPGLPSGHLRSPPSSAVGYGGRATQLTFGPDAMSAG